MTLADKLGRPKQSTLAMPICANLHQVREKESPVSLTVCVRLKGREKAGVVKRFFLTLYSQLGT
jgi:hypothetical protein